MKYCGKEMGYRHMSGTKAYCGDDVGTHIIYCIKCKKINDKQQLKINKSSEVFPYGTSMDDVKNDIKIKSSDLCICGHIEKLHWYGRRYYDSGCSKCECKEFKLQEKRE